MDTPFPSIAARSSRRSFFGGIGAISTAALVPKLPSSILEESAALPVAFSGLKPLGERVRPITPVEFTARIEQAQSLMAAAPPAPSGSPAQATKYDALFFAPGKIGRASLGKVG